MRVPLRTWAVFAHEATLDGDGVPPPHWLFFSTVEAEAQRVYESGQLGGRVLALSLATFDLYRGMEVVSTHTDWPAVVALTGHASPALLTHEAAFVDFLNAWAIAIKHQSWRAWAVNVEQFGVRPWEIMGIPDPSCRTADDAAVIALPGTPDDLPPERN